MGRNFNHRLKNLFYVRVPKGEKMAALVASHVLFGGHENLKFWWLVLKFGSGSNIEPWNKGSILASHGPKNPILVASRKILNFFVASHENFICVKWYLFVIFYITHNFYEYVSLE